MAAPADLSAIPGLMQRLRSGRPAAQVLAADGLNSLARAGSSAQCAVAEAGAIPVLVQLASKGRAELQQSAGIALCSIIRGQQGLIQAFL